MKNWEQLTHVWTENALLHSTACCGLQWSKYVSFRRRRVRRVCKHSCERTVRLTRLCIRFIWARLRLHHQ